MNQGKSSKFVPGLPDDEPSNENIPTAPDSTINIFEGVAECTVNESDTFKSVKLRAKNLAEDNVQKQIADYIRAFLKDRYLTLPDDETLSIANEISTINDVKYNTRDSDDDIVIRATVTAQLDNKDIMNYIIRFFKERAELKSEIVALRKEIEELKLQEDKVSSEKSALATQNKDLKSQNDVLRNKTVALNNQIDGLNGELRDKQKTIDSLNGELRDKQNAIDGLNGELRDKQNAIDSLNGQLRDKQNAIDEFKRQPTEEEIKSKDDLAWKLFCLNDFRGALKLYDELIRLKPNNAGYYFCRGRCYEKLGEHSKAQSDRNKYEKLRR